MADHRKELNDLLDELAKKQEGLKEDEIWEYVKELQGIYRDGFRHWYSDVFSIVARVYHDNSDAARLLSNNIKDIYQAVNQNEKNGEDTLELRKSVKKLYDHVNLDVARMQDTEKQFKEWDRAQDSERRKLGVRVEMLSEKAESMWQKAESMQRKAESMQKDYITILGIFAAILITFVAGMTFSSSILNNMDKVSIYRLTFVILVIALMLFNLLHMLIEFIGKMQNCDIETRFGQRRFQSKSFIINVVLLSMLLLDFICWFVWHRVM